MNAEKYQNIVDKHKPKEDKFYNGLIAFIVGGILGLISNFILNLYSYLFHTLDISSLLEEISSLSHSIVFLYFLVLFI